jgi:CRISPR-associated endonuclease/helicase Cas3
VAGYFDYWGKARATDQAEPFHLLAFHSLDVAAVAAELLERDGRWLERVAPLSGFTAPSLRKVLPYLVALHDLGKFSEPFQDQQSEIVAGLQGPRPPRASRFRHDTVGNLLWRSWAGRRPDPREAGVFDELHGIVLPSGPASRRDVGWVLETWMAAVLGHHGKPPENGALAMEVFKAHPESPLARSREDAVEFCLSVKRLLSPGELVAELEDVDELIARAKRSSWWLAGFTILCDWLGSDTEFFRYASSALPIEDYWPIARRAAADAVRCSGLGQSRPAPFVGMHKLFPAIAEPTPLQHAASEVDLGSGPQLFVLEDLTGSGKTEAALVLTQRLIASGRGDGLFFALPTMATANAMDARVEPLVEALFEGKPSYLLTHSGPRLNDRDRLAIGGGGGEAPTGGAEHPTATATASSWLADGRKKALLAEMGVGTVDQALLAALQSGHAALRLLGLHRHVLIVDEVHACDAYMLGVLCALLKAHAALGGSAVLLSATLPREQREALLRAFADGLGVRGCTTKREEYPLLTAFGTGRLVEQPIAPRQVAARTLPIRWHHTTADAVERVVEAAGAGLCACWIRNSVKDAIETYEAVAAALGPDRVTLFHARFALGDRLRIEQAVVERFGKDGRPELRSGHVVIATQVVEQSLDIDFDVMVTDLCPIDLVIQRAGRLQRHRRGSRPDPILDVVAPRWSDDPPKDWLGPPFQRTAHVYPDPAVLWRTCRALRGRGNLALPEDARLLVEAVYACADTPESLATRSSAAVGQDLAHASVARNAVLQLDLGYVREGADWSSEARTPTRLGEPTTTVRLARVGDNGASAWFSPDGRPHWPLSQLSVARRLIAKPVNGDEALRRALDATQPFVGEDVVTVLLRQDGDARWIGEAIAERSRAGNPYDVRVKVLYSESRGLEIEDKE